MSSGPARSVAYTHESGKVAVVIGGLGCLPPRILTPWLSDPASVERLRWMTQITGLDLIYLGTVAGQDELRTPEKSLPLRTALAMLAGERLLSNACPERVMIAGHGTGEVAAAAIAGVVAPEAGLGLAVKVGRAQALAAAATPGFQVAILGGYPAEVETRAAELALSIAAYNGAGEIVVAGPHEALGELLRDPPRHARVEALPTAGAFSSGLMENAAYEVREALTDLVTGDPRFPLLSGCDGRAVTSGRSFLQSMASQLTGPVRWDMTMNNLAAAGVRVIMELPPAGALTGLIARALPDVIGVALSDPRDLAEAAPQLVGR